MGTSRVVHDPAKGVGPLAGIAAAAPAGVTVVAGSTAEDAADADFIVVIAGLTAGDEGEEFTGAGDRTSFGIDAKRTDPTVQTSLIAAAAALGKPMVVVLEGSSVMDMPWLSSVPAVVMAFYPGMVGGSALGKLLWGEVNGQKYNFSGKLPFTWGGLADYGTFKSESGGTPFDYYEGYRHFDHAAISPIYPFGSGLSYTSFEYRKLQLGCSDMSKGAVLPVAVNVANTGTVGGDEVVMVFVSFPGTTARRPAKELKGFARVHLEAGEEKQVTIPVRLADLDYFQTDATNPATGKWVVETGDVKIMVGGSSAHLPLSAVVTVTGY
jgi:beta-glucosidase